MATPTQPKTPWYACCLGATIEPEPQLPYSPAAKYHYAGKFTPQQIQARLTPQSQTKTKEHRDVDATNGKSLPTARRHRKLDSQEVVDLKGALKRASVTADPQTPKTKKLG